MRGLADRAMARVVEIGFSRHPLSLDELEELLVEFEERIRSSIRKKLKRRIDELEIVVEADIASDGTLTVRVDTRVTGRFIAPYSYDEVVAEAIDEAASWLEERLRERVAAKASREATNTS